jgi:hypothetical protein
MLYLVDGESKRDEANKRNDNQFEFSPCVHPTPRH